MFTLLFTLCAILSIAAKAQTDCDNKYVVVNSFEDVDQIKVSCYNETSPCSLFYSPSKQKDVKIDLGIVNANASRVVVADIGYGGRLYSNHQIGVSYESFSSTGAYNFVTLPRAPDAGKNFVVDFTFVNPRAASHYLECSFSATLKSATVSYQTNIDDRVEVFDVQEHESVLRKIYLDTTQNLTVRFTSDEPIIITSYDRAREVFRTWEPISSLPVFAFIEDNYVTISLSNCRTNEEITDFSLVRVRLANFYGHSCTSYRTSPSVTADNLIVGGKCMIMVQSKSPQVCTSLSVQLSQSGMFEGLGYPISKKVSQVHNFSTLASSITTFSSNANNCQISDSMDNRIIPYEENSTGTPLLPLFYQIYTHENLGDFGNLACQQSAFVYELSSSQIPIYNLGLQAESLWNEYFYWIGCYP